MSKGSANIGPEKLNELLKDAEVQLRKSEEFIASSEGKNWVMTYSGLSSNALDSALTNWFAGDRNKVIPLLRRSAEASRLLLEAEPRMQQVFVDGKLIGEELETSSQNTHRFLICSQLALIAGDAELLKKAGAIDHLKHFCSMTTYRNPERYEEARVLQEICQGKDAEARERLKSWDGTQTQAELKELRIGKRKFLFCGKDSKLDPWTGHKTPFLRCIEAVLNVNEPEFKEAIDQELKGHHKFRAQRYHSWIQEEVCVPALAAVLFAKRKGMDVRINNKYLPEGLVQLLLDSAEEPRR